MTEHTPLIDRIKSKIMGLESRQQGMISYMQLKVQERDYHAIFDAAADCRDLETEITSCRDMIDLLKTQ